MILCGCGFMISDFRLLYFSPGHQQSEIRNHKSKIELQHLQIRLASQYTGISMLAS
jgi:hypothetical protein